MRDNSIEHYKKIYLNTNHLNIENKNEIIFNHSFLIIILDEFNLGL